MIGYAVCGSFCTHEKSLAVLEKLSRKWELLPIVSEISASTDTRFGKSQDLLSRVKSITGHTPILTVREAEPLGPASPLDMLIISPCTGNTLAKLSRGITDTVVTMAAKAHLRANRPLLIALASNDALSGNLGSLGLLLNRKNVYFTPMRQDDPAGKPHSLVADFDKIPECMEAAFKGEQKRPLFI